MIKAYIYQKNFYIIYNHCENHEKENYKIKTKYLEFKKNYDDVKTFRFLKSIPTKSDKATNTDH